MLIIKNLTKIYTSEKGLPVEALSNVSAKFGEKGLIFLTGKSGSGKSTMLNLLGGLDVPSSGEIIINNRSSISFKEKDFDSYRNTYVGFIFQEYNLIENFTVGANIGFALELQGKKPDRNEIEKILRKVDLVEHGGTLFNRYVDELSGGQKQRVAIARALIKNPEVILADEPTGALDTKTGQQLYELLKELAKEKLIIVVSHDIKNAKKYADGIIKLHDGKIISNTISVDNSSQLKTPTNFKKSKLRFKRSFAMGVKALKAKPIRLVISLLLLITTNVIFGFSLTLNTSSKIDAELNALYENNQSMVTLTGCAVDSNDNIVCQYRNFTDAQMDLIKKYNNNVEPMHAFPYPINHEKVFYYDYIGSLPEHVYFSKAEDILGHGFQDPMSVVEVDYETGESDAKLTPDSRFINQALCRLPITNNEIAITDLYADIFMGRGYKNGKQSSHVISINSPDDLIGLTLGGLTICGVYSTEQNFLEWNTLPMMFDQYSSLYEGGLFVSTLTKGFVCKGYGGNSSVSGVLLELSGDIQKDRALINKLTYKIGRDTYSTVHLESVYTLLASALYSYQDTTYYATIIIAFILSAIFAVLLTMNFLSASMDSKKKEIGILRALGAREKDIQMICLTESIVVASIQFIVSLIVLFILCNYVNKFFIPLLVVDFIPIGGLLLLSFGLSTLASIKPVRKLVKYKPINIIINKDK